jgi:hypothetical protein
VDRADVFTQKATDEELNAGEEEHCDYQAGDAGRRELPVPEHIQQGQYESVENRQDRKDEPRRENRP